MGAMMNRRALNAGLGAAFGVAIVFGVATAELPVEPTPAVGALPAQYPNSYVFLVDPNFFGMESGKVVIADVGAAVDHHKGAVGAAQFGFFAAAKTRPELYVAETFYARGQRGERTDVITIYDKSTLTPKGEIVLPGAKRAQLLTEAGAFQLSADERFAFVYNFTPAASITVVDLVNRKVAGEVDVPGCVHAFALRPTGFASLCGNGAVASTILDANGRFVAQTMSAPFNDIDNDPMFTRPAIIGNIAYFPTYSGKIQPIDFSGPEAVPGEAWAIPAPPVEVKKKKGFLKRIAGSGDNDLDTGKRLPSGWQLTAFDDAGRLYVIMRATENPDDHDTGGDEVWVVDPKSKTLLNRLKLRADASIIEVTAGADPLLVAARPDFSFDVYKANTGEWVRRIGGQIVMTPFAAFAAK
jgi:methylamine dehydrogenase heavy chain